MHAECFNTKLLSRNILINKYLEHVLTIHFVTKSFKTTN